jgi:predicted dehydrogenase
LEAIRVGIVGTGFAASSHIEALRRNLGVAMRFTGPTGIENTVGRVTPDVPAPHFTEMAWTKDSAEWGAPVTSASATTGST